jgi:serine/threonine-protein kinase
MPPLLIGPRPVSTPVVLASSRTTSAPLPPDLLREAALRLGILSLVTGGLWLLGTAFGHLSLRELTAPGDPRWRQLDMTDVIAAACVVLSLALYRFTRRTTRDPQFVLDLGLVYMTVMAFGLGIMFHWFGAPPNYPISTHISWIGVMILMVAAILPSSMPKMLLAASISVAMNPLGMLISRVRNHGAPGSLRDLVLMHYPDFMLVGVALVISRVMTQLGRQVRKEREMGSYQLTELLGRGGMGEVYRAQHRMLARPAAIKLIRPEALGAPDSEPARLAVRRFHREAEAAANLRSPHSVEIYDFGVTEDGTLYFVMELLDGMDLEALVSTHGPLPPARVIHILLQVCESLEEAHRAGLVHRDIKPANIHVGRLGLRDDFVKVLDFGLVRPVDPTPTQDSMATIAGQTPGTPAYMAPEMALAERVDARTDLYALGCVAYFLLTGRLVFEADTAYQMIARHLESVPQPPSFRTDNHVPRALDDLVLHCLAKEPDDRPRSAAELAQRLAAIDVLAWGGDEAARWWAARRAPTRVSAPGPA